MGGAGSRGTWAQPWAASDAKRALVVVRGLSRRDRSVGIPWLVALKTFVESRCMHRLFRTVFRGLATPEPLLCEEVMRLAEQRD